MHTTSASLLERLREPTNPQTWTRFVQLYTRLLFFWARRLGLQEEDAADLVQDVFSTLVQELPDFRYDPGKSFRSWLRTVLLNTWRQHQRRAAPPLVQVSPGVLAERAGPEDPEALDETEYREHLVRRALQLMQAEFAKTWKACWEHVVAGRSAAEVADELGISVGSVYVAKSRVLGRLRQELQGLLD